MPTPNTKQQECIDNLNGQYLVLAGPGTGKTFTIVKRIQNMISQGVNPEKILCLTFTETASKEMKSRIDSELNALDSGVNVYTYHSFCNEIIKDNPKDFELPENFRLISTAVSRSFIKECIDEIKPIAFRTEKNDPYYFLNDILNMITAVKQNRLTKEKYFYNLENNQNWIPQLEVWKNKNIEAVKNGKKETNLSKISTLEKSIAKAKELWLFYELYAEKMNKYHYIDFNDMITMVLEKFEKDAGFLAKIANKYEYLLVDEYQDTNPIQNEVIFNLVKGLDEKNVFVVGDDDQIIFTFQGARLDTIEKFLKEFPETKVICLNENMRSTQTILDVAREIAKQDTNRLEINPEFSRFNITKDLTAKNEKTCQKDKKVRFYRYADAIQEYNEIVKEIEGIVNSPDCPLDENGNKAYSEIAILTRSNTELETFAEMLKDKNIPYELKEGKNIFNIKSVTIMYYYMQMLVNPELYSDRIFRILLNPPFNINSKDYEKIYEVRTKNKSLINSIKELTPQDCQNYKLIEKFTTDFDKLREFISTETLRNIILEIGNRTGIFEYYLNAEINRCENIAGLKKLLDIANEISDINKTSGLEDFINYLDTCIIEEIEIKTDKAPVKMNAVQLSTYHSAKGKEYEYVYMPTLFNTKWESKKTDKPEIPLAPCEAKTDDEFKAQKYADCIKVMFVGMTRAKHTLRLSYFTPSGTRTKLTCFIANIQDILEKEETPFEYNETSYWEEMTKSLIKKEYDYKKDFTTLVDLKTKDKFFSPNSINKYLKCPRQFLFDYVLDLSSKATNPDAYSFGSAVHRACEFAINYAIQNKTYPQKEDFIKTFKEDAQNRAFSSYEQRQIHLERGEKALETFFHHLTDTPIESLMYTEHNIKFNIEGNNFTGIVDRIDKNEDGTYSIYDYKTGSAKNQNDIGLGKNHEDYYNQIGLYKYLFEKSTGNKVKDTTFIFPEYPESNFTLELNEEECEAIKDKFLDAIKNIKSYNFEPCSDRNKNSAPCKYCGFKDFCNLEVI